MQRKIYLAVVLVICQFIRAEQVFEQKDAPGHADHSGVQKYSRDQVRPKKWHPRERPYSKSRKLDDDSVHFSEYPVDEEICSRGVNRLKNNKINVTEEFMYAERNTRYNLTDYDFSFPEAIHWNNLPGQYEYASHVKYISWSRMKNKFGDDRYSLWGKDSVNPEDAIQGEIGNCWLISAAMSLAESEARLKDFFLVDEKNSASVYAANLYLLGTPITVVVDDFVPLALNSIRRTIFASVGEDGALWGLLFEKIFAKYYGNYEMVDAGHAAAGVEIASGAPYTSWPHIDIEPDDAEELWQKLYSESTTGVMITTGSHTGTGDDQDSNDDGLPFNHAFSIMRALYLELEDGTKVRLVEIRNPWGTEGFAGNWSDKDPRWTESLLAQVDHSFDNDGKFYMEYEDYLEQMEYTDFNIDVSQMHRSSFVFERDDEPRNRNTVFRGDPTEYNIHYINVTSEIDQDVYISAHTYGMKHYHGACAALFSKNWYTEVLVALDSSLFQAVNPGSYHFEKSFMSAGESKKIKILTHYTKDDFLPHDWSLVAWSSREPVQIDYVNENGWVDRRTKSREFWVQSLPEDISVPKYFPAQEAEEDPDQITDQQYDDVWPLTMEEIQALKKIWETSSDVELSDELMQLKYELEDKLTKWIDVFGFGFWTEEEVLYWIEEQINIQKMELTYEELENYELYLSGSKFRDDIFYELQQKFHDWKVAAFEWMYPDQMMIDYLQSEIAERPTRLEQFKKIKAYLEAQANQFEDTPQPTQDEFEQMRQILLGFEKFREVNEYSPDWTDLEIVDMLVRSLSEDFEEEDDDDDSEKNWPDVEVIDLTGDGGIHLDVSLLNVGPQNNTVNFTGYNKNETWELGLSINNATLKFNITLNDTGLIFGLSSPYRWAWEHSSFGCTWNDTFCDGRANMTEWRFAYDFIMGGDSLPYGYWRIYQNDTKDIHVEMHLDFQNSLANVKLVDHKDTVLYEKEYRFTSPKDTLQLNLADSKNYTRSDGYSLFQVNDNFTSYSQDNSFRQLNHSLSVVDLEEREAILNTTLVYIFGRQGLNLIIPRRSDDYEQSDEGRQYIMCKDKEGEEEVSMRCSDPIEQGDWRYAMYFLAEQGRMQLRIQHLNSSLELISEVDLYSHNYNVNRTDMTFNETDSRIFDLTIGFVRMTTFKSFASDYVKVTDWTDTDEILDMYVQLEHVGFNEVDVNITRQVEKTPAWGWVKQDFTIAIGREELYFQLETERDSDWLEQQSSFYINFKLGDNYYEYEYERCNYWDDKCEGSMTFENYTTWQIDYAQPQGNILRLRYQSNETDFAVIQQIDLATWHIFWEVESARGGLLYEKLSKALQPRELYNQTIVTNKTYEFEDNNVTVHENFTTFFNDWHQPIMVFQTLSVVNSTGDPSDYWDYEEQVLLDTMNFTHIMNTDNYTVIINSNLTDEDVYLSCPGVEGPDGLSQNCSSPALIGEWTVKVGFAFNDQIKWLQVQPGREFLSDLDQKFPETLHTEYYLENDYIVRTNAYENDIYEIRELTKELEVRVFDATGWYSMLIDLRIENAGAALSPVNVTAYSLNDTWISNRTLDEYYYLVYNASGNDTGFQFNFEACEYGCSADLSCLWNQTNCTGELNIDYEWNLTYSFYQDYDYGEPQLFMKYYHFYNPTVYFQETIYFGEMTHFNFALFDNRTDEILYEKYTRIVTPKEAAYFANATDAKEHDFYDVQFNVTSDFTQWWFGDEEPAILQTGQSIKVYQLDEWTYWWNQTILDANITLTSTFDGVAMIVYPDDQSVHHTRCSLQYEGIQCEDPVTHKNWTYTLRFYPQEESVIVEIFYIPADQNSTANMTTPHSFSTVFDSRGGIVRTDAFSNDVVEMRVVEVNSTKVTDRRLQVADLTGDYIMHLDVRLANVGRDDHPVNLTGYSDEYGQWTLNRSVGNSSFAYAIYGSEEGFEIDLWVDDSSWTYGQRREWERYMQFRCSYSEALYDCSFARGLGPWWINFDGIIDTEVWRISGFKMEYYVQNFDDVIVQESINLMERYANVTVFNDEWEPLYNKSIFVAPEERYHSPGRMQNSTVFEFKNQTYQVNHTYVDYGVIANQTLKIDDLSRRQGRGLQEAERRGRAVLDTSFIYTAPDFETRAVIIQLKDGDVHSLTCWLPYDYGYGYYGYYAYYGMSYDESHWRRRLQSSGNSTDADWNDGDGSEGDWIERNWVDENQINDDQYINGYWVECSDTISLEGWNYTLSIAGRYQRLSVTPARERSRGVTPQLFETTFDYVTQTLTQKDQFTRGRPSIQTYDLHKTSKVSFEIDTQYNSPQYSSYEVQYLNEDYAGNRYEATLAQYVQYINDTAYMQYMTLSNWTTDDVLSITQVVNYNRSDEVFITVNVEGSYSGSNISDIRRFNFNLGSGYTMNSEYKLNLEAALYIDIYRENLQRVITQSIWFEHQGLEIAQEISLDWYGSSSWNQKLAHWEEVKEGDWTENFILDDEWRFYTSDGPLYEKVELFDESSYDLGFEEGYTKGYSQAEIDLAPKVPEIDQSRLEELVNGFPRWVKLQSKTPSALSCDSGINISRPYPNEPLVWAFWAGHDCEDYTLLVTVVFSDEAIAQLKGFYGADLSSTGCFTYSFNDLLGCEFEIKEAGRGFGLLFVGEFTPVFYLTKWKKAKDWTDSFNWW